MKTRGFTLIELMIVSAIIGIIAALIVPFFKSDSTNYSPPPQNSVVVSSESDAPKCSNGYLIRGDKAMTNKDGEAVKC